VIRDVGEAVGDAVMSSVGRVFGRAQEQRPLESDLLESEDAYLVVFDAPGVRAEDVQVRYEDGTVHVRLDRYREHEPDFEMRFPGRGLTLSGKRALPEDAAVDPEASTANLTANGTLEVRVPKGEADAEGEAGVEREAGAESEVGAESEDADGDNAE
jgi:HSP20 family protein